MREAARNPLACAPWRGEPAQFSRLVCLSLREFVTFRVVRRNGETLDWVGLVMAGLSTIGVVSWYF